MNQGQRLRLFLETVFGTVAAAARAMKITEQSFYPYMKGKKEPGALILKRLAGFGCNIHWLLTGDGEMLTERYVPAVVQEAAAGVSVGGGPEASLPRFPVLPLVTGGVRARGVSLAVGPSVQRVDVGALMVPRPGTSVLMRYRGVRLPGFGIEPGDILVIDRGGVPEPGEIVVTKIGKEEPGIYRCVVAGGMVVLETGERVEKPERKEIPAKGYTVTGVVTTIVRAVHSDTREPEQ